MEGGGRVLFLETIALSTRGTEENCGNPQTKWPDFPADVQSSYSYISNTIEQVDVAVTLWTFIREVP